MPSNNDIDITKNIKVIENYKCQLLNSLAELFTSMADTSAPTSSRNDILSNMVLLTYLLGDKLGVSYHTLDNKVLNKIKLGMLEEELTSEWRENLVALGKHIDRNRDL